MLKLLVSLPKTLTVAFSGGVDSVAAVDFLRRRHNVSCAFFHHATEECDKAFDFVSRFCSQHKLDLIIGNLSILPTKGTSKEEFWRNERYKFLESLNSPVVTVHHLDDCMETYIYSSLHGQPKVIPMQRNNILRPFLTTPKKAFVNWCRKHELEWYEDLSNGDTKYMRNYIRHEVMPRALVVNPGLAKVVQKIVERKRFETI